MEKLLVTESVWNVQHLKHHRIQVKREPQGESFLSTFDDRSFLKTNQPAFPSPISADHC